MIIEEIREKENLIYHYSDLHKYILQNETGIKYEDALDIMPCRYTYSETNEDIPDPDPPEVI